MLRGNDSVAPVNTETMEKVQEKFPVPKKDAEPLNPVPDDAPTFVIDLGDFIPLFRSAINGGAGGRTGLTGEHFKPLLTRPDVMTALLRVVTLLIDGAFPRWTQPYLSVHRLLALGEKCRPVGVVEFIVRLANCVIVPSKKRV